MLLVRECLDRTSVTTTQAPTIRLQKYRPPSSIAPRSRPPSSSILEHGGPQHRRGYSNITLNGCRVTSSATQNIHMYGIESHHRVQRYRPCKPKPAAERGPCCVIRNGWFHPFVAGWPNIKHPNVPCWPPRFSGIVRHFARPRLVGA